MTDEKSGEKRLSAAKVASLIGGPGAVDDKANVLIEDEIVECINQVVRPYLMEVLPAMIRKLNHAGVLDKLVRTHCENLLKNVLEEYLETATDDLRAKIDKKFREMTSAGFDARIEQAAHKLLDDKLAKLRAEFGK